MKPFVMVILAAGSLLLVGQRKPVHQPAAVKSVIRKAKQNKTVYKTDVLDNIPNRFSMQLFFQ